LAGKTTKIWKDRRSPNNDDLETDFMITEQEKSKEDHRQARVISDVINDPLYLREEIDQRISSQKPSSGLSQ
jgi:hypothetical protein